ncbi:MAG: sec-independent protein translocase protein TatC [Parcubacteria bacterium C7867-004]|nr:MAG: sec-independent protein translocase protein TatC [Parcubacteria bacterium C7867-004]
MTRRSDAELSVWEHLSELRTYFFIALAALIAGAIVTHVYNAQITALLFAPLHGESLVFLSPLDPLLFIFKIDLFGGLILALPIIFYCLFRFIAPALGNRGSVFIGSFLVVSLLLVLAASVYTYLLLLPISIGFLLSLNVAGVENFFTADRYIDFALMQLVLTVGIFQIPCIIVLLAFTKLLDPKKLAKNRGMAYIAAIVALSVLTPTTDLYSLALFLLPTLFIFEISILLGRAVYSLRNKSPMTYE